MKFGVMMFPTDYAISVVELGRAAEGSGFDSLWLPEHTHIPTSRLTPHPAGQLPEEYRHTIDPFVSLAAVAATTTELKLATGICLVIQRDTITLAKEVASLDAASHGRFLFGIGAGWNRDEIENHGTRYPVRWRKLREQIEAMKAIWTQDEAEYHGDFVNFDRMWSWPKPVQKPHPPIIMGGDGPKGVEGLLDYCDEWLPRVGWDVAEPLEQRLAEVNRQAAERGRGPIPFTLTLEPDPRQIERYEKLGAQRVNFRMPPAPATEVLPLLAERAELIKSFR
jgi:probable F420-dependent oxidoreductase